MTVGWMIGGPARAGTIPDLTLPPDPPDPVDPPIVNAAQAYPTKSMAVYQMCYPQNQTWIDVLAQHAPNVNVVRLAFFVGNPPGIVGYTSAGQSALSTQLRALRATGVRIHPSFGGAHNTVGWGRTGVVNALRSFNDNICPIDGFDVDVEGGGLPTAAALKDIIDDMRNGGANPRGANFGCTFVPNGSWVGAYLPVAAGLHAYGANYMLAYGQQFYDAPVDDAAMKTRITAAINAGIPFSRWEMSVMNPSTGYAPDSSYWTVDTAITRINSAKAAYGSGMRGSYYWETMRTPPAQATPIGKAGNASVGGAGNGTLQWASRVGAVI